MCSYVAESVLLVKLYESGIPAHSRRADVTDNHQFETPEKGTLNWNVPINENFQKLDTDVEIRDQESQLDAYTAKEGAKFFALDTGTVYVGDGDSWTRAPRETLSVDKSFRLPLLEADPSDATIGELWFRSDSGELRVQTDAGPQVVTGGSGGDTATSEPAYDVVEPFDDTGWTETFGEVWNYGVGDHTDIRDVTGRSGNQLEMRVPSGENRGVYTVHNHASRTGTAPTELYQQFSLRFGPGFYDNLTDDGKLPGFAGRDGTDEGAGGTPADGTGWSARMGWDDPGDHDGTDVPLDWYIYHMDAPGSYGDHEFIALLPEGEWHTIEQYIDLGSPGQNDGVLQCRVDGTLEYDRSDFRFRESGGNDVQWTWWDFYHGGGNTPEGDITVQFDDLKIMRDARP